MSQRQSQTPGQQPGATPSGLAGNLRPHYFNKSPTLSALLSGKSLSSSASSASSRLLNPYPTPPSSPPLAPSTSANTHKADAPSAQQAMLASMASQTLFSKLGGAFWDAFARPSGALGPNGHAKQEWDADKVRRVMEGTAVVRVVETLPLAGGRSARVGDLSQPFLFTFLLRLLQLLADLADGWECRHSVDLVRAQESFVHRDVWRHKMS